MKLLTLIGCGLTYVAIFSITAQDDLSQSIERGKDLYMESCVTCHLANGQGVKGTFPPLAKSDFLLKYPEKSIHSIKFGMNGKVVVNGVTYNNAMPPSGFADDEIADVMNYIRNSFGNKNTQMITEKIVAAVKEK